MGDRSAQTLSVAFPRPEPRLLTGEVELAVAEAAGCGSRPERVTSVIGAVFQRLGALPTEPATLLALGSGPREWLLQQAALCFWRGSGWFEARCTACDAPFDAPADLASAPRGPAGAGYPVIEVATSLGPRRFEAPNGHHETQLAGGAPSSRRLLALCGLAATADDDAAQFSEADLIRVSDAFDAACPDVADTLTLSCPVCKAPTDARLDPLSFAFPKVSDVLDDVHRIAGAYHWSEPQILALPRARRRRYAAMISAERRHP